MSQITQEQHVEDWRYGPLGKAGADKKLGSAARSAVSPEVTGVEAPSASSSVMRKAEQMSTAEPRERTLDELTDLFKATYNVPSTPRRQSEVNSRTVWAYWGQGYEAMPEFFKLCVDTWQRHNPHWEVRILERSTVCEFLSAAELPNRFPELSHQLASDCVRLALLARYGGVWLDVSVILLSDLDSLCWGGTAVGPKTPTFFHPQHGTEALKGSHFVESWFLAARYGNPFFLRWRDLLSELLHNRTDTEGLLNHPLHSGLDLSGIHRAKSELQFPNDCREHLALQTMFHRILEKDTALHAQWREWQKLEATSATVCLSTEADAEDSRPELLRSPTAAQSKRLQSVPLVKLTTLQCRALLCVPAERLFDEETVIGQLLGKRTLSAASGTQKSGRVMVNRGVHARGFGSTRAGGLLVGLGAAAVSHSSSRSCRRGAQVPQSFVMSARSMPRVHARTPLTDHRKAVGVPIFHPLKACQWWRMPPLALLRLPWRSLVP